MAVTATRKRAPIKLADGLTLPLDAVTRTFGIVGQRGSGKSTTGATFVEQIVYSGGRSVVFDPTGVWHGLTRAGAGPGLPGVVLGGENGDAPLQPHTGALVAEFVMGSNYPLVVLDMKLMRKGQRQHFAMEFLEALYHDNRDPLMVVFDEAPQFAPQMMRGKGEDAVVPRLLGAVEDVVSLGRSRGLGATFIAQRIAMVNANVREQVETLVAHRLIGKLDRTALKGWIEAQADPEREKEVLDMIAKLPTGRALVWSPAFLDYFGVVDVDNATTFDSRATPKVGERVKKPGKRTPVDLATLQAKMAEVIEEAEANDPRKLRNRVAELEAKLRIEGEAATRLSAERISLLEQLEARPPETVTVEVPVVTEKELARIEKIVSALESAHGIVTTGYGELRDVLYPLASNVKGALDGKYLKSLPEQVERGQRIIAQGRESLAAAPAKQVAPRAPVPAGDATITGVMQRILNGLAWWEAIGVTQPSRTQLAFVVGYHTRSKSFTNALSAMNTSGLVSYPTSGYVALTDAGRAQSVPPDIAPTDKALHALIFQQIGPLRTRILQPIMESYPNEMTREQLAEVVGYHPRAKSFTNALSSLRTYGVIDYPQPGVVKATALLWPPR